MLLSVVPDAHRPCCLIMGLKLHYRLLVVVIVFLSTVYLLQRYITSWQQQQQQQHELNFSMNRKSPGINTPVLEYFRVRDPLDVIWYSPQTVEEAKTRANQMLSVDVEGREDLEQWLDVTRNLYRVGLKLNFKNLRVLEPCLHHLYDVRNNIHFPVIVHADVEFANEDDNGGMRADVLNLPLFLFKLKTSYWDIQFSVGHVPSSTSDTVQLKDMETLQGHLRYFTQSVYITVCASVLRKSWRPLRWLLQNSDNRFLIITCQKKVNSLCSDVPLFDLLLARNDWLKEKVYFDIPEADLIHFRSLVVTAGSPLHHFEMSDAAMITWAHRVNRKHLLNKVLKSSTLFLEADILLEGGDHREAEPKPIMAHPPEVSSDITFQKWLDTVCTSGKGMKLDFKSIDSVAPSLKILAAKHKTEGIKQPILLNADVLPGPNTDRGVVNASAFLSYVNNLFPEVGLSLGWVTKWNDKSGNAGYTRDMMERMNKLALHLRQPVTFPLRASLVRRSWEHIDWLLEQSRGYTLTIWTPWPLGVSDTETVTKEDMRFVRNNTESSRVYFDLPAELMPV